MSHQLLSSRQKIILAFMAISTLGIMIYAFYLSLTLYSYFIIGRDEANFLLRSSLDFSGAETILDSLQQLFQVHGQHVLVGMQLANQFSFLLFGSLDFQFINFMGLIYLVIPALLICAHLKSSDHPCHPAIAFIIAMAVTFPLVLSPAHISCAINTACTGNHYLGLGLAIIALYLFVPLSAQNLALPRALTAELFVMIAIFSSPAALAIVPLFYGLILFFHHKKLFLLALHTLATFFTLSLYFYVAESADFSYAENLTPLAALKTIVMFGVLFFNTLGSVFFWPEQPLTVVISIGIGIAILTIALWQIKTSWPLLKERRDLLFFASGFLLMLGMIGLIALGRLGTFGSTRYTFYGCFALVFLLLFWIARHPHTLKPAPIAIALLCLSYYPAQWVLNQPYIERIRGEIIACNARWYSEGRACGVMMKHSDATALLLEAEKQGILRLPPP